MASALYTKDAQETNAVGLTCPDHTQPAIAWSDDLPPTLQSLVVAPISFHVSKDYEIRADSTKGCDAANQPCFCKFRFVLTELRADEDDVFYEAPIYAETLTSWRLLDDRWLVRRTTVEKFEAGDFDTCFSISNTMPR